MSAKQIADVATKARTQVSGSVSWTRSQAASTANCPPTGTPVCLMEKISGAYFGGLCRASRCELAGVEKEFAAPMTTAASANAQSVPTMLSARPRPRPSNEIWLARIAPQRMMSPPTLAWKMPEMP